MAINRTPSGIVLPTGAAVPNGVAQPPMPPGVTEAMARQMMAETIDAARRTLAMVVAALKAQHPEVQGFAPSLRDPAKLMAIGPDGDFLDIELTITLSSPEKAEVEPKDEATPETE